MVQDWAIVEGPLPGLNQVCLVCLRDDGKQEKKPFKGLLAEFQVALHAKMAMPYSQQYHLNLNRIKNE